jgi:hypothetical protein
VKNESASLDVPEFNLGPLLLALRTEYADESKDDAFDQFMETFLEDFLQSRQTQDALLVEMDDLVSLLSKWCLSFVVKCSRGIKPVR